MQQPMDLETWKRVSLKFSRLKNDPHLRAILPRNYAGCLMGFGGQTARKIQNSLNVFLQIHEVEHARWGRVMSIKGSPIKQSKAWYECAILLLEGYYETYKQFGFSIDFIFPTELVELFLFQDDFQRIATASHTTIMVKHNCLMRSTERVVRVHTQDLSAASIKYFQKFVYMISELVDENLKLSLCSTGNKFYVEHADDDIMSFIKTDTAKDLVFHPRMEVQHRSPPLNESRTKREDPFDMDESEHYSSGSDLKGRESGNSSYYDATSEKGEFEELNTNDNEQHNEGMIAVTNQNAAYDSSQTSIQDEEIHQNERTDEDRINEIDQGVDKRNTENTLDDLCKSDFKNSCIIEEDDSSNNKGNPVNESEENNAAVEDQSFNREEERDELNSGTQKHIEESPQCSVTNKTEDAEIEIESKELKECEKSKQSITTDENEEINGNTESTHKGDNKVVLEVGVDKENSPTLSPANDLNCNNHSETESST